PAEPPRPRHRPRLAGDGGGDPVRVGPRVPRPERSAADSELGWDASGWASVPDERVVDGGISRSRHRYNRPRAQPLRGVGPRSTRTRKPRVKPSPTWTD